ncbi:MAG: hypothetical protein ABEJ86_06515 [Halococcoides sp.]
MTVRDFLMQAYEDYQTDGIRSIQYTAGDLFHGLLSRAGFFLNYGEDFYEYDWDLLILLDACRWDLMEEVVEEYDVLESRDTFVGQSSHSREFLHKTFMENSHTGLAKIPVWLRILRDPDDIETFNEYFQMRDDREIDETAYITWNMFSEMLDGDAFFDYVSFRGQKWEYHDQILSPRKLTDYTIDLLRRENPERTIVHYMQPHNPFRNSDGTEVSMNVWERIQRGEKDPDEAWDGYRDNLRWVLDDVELLLENVDAERVVISSDHGNLIGEWGCYGHRPYVPIGAVKRVPWVETTATDEHTHDPDIDESITEDEATLEDRLEALGYK